MTGTIRERFVHKISTPAIAGLWDGLEGFALENREQPATALRFCYWKKKRSEE